MWRVLSLLLLAKLIESSEILGISTVVENPWVEKRHSSFTGGNPLHIRGTFDYFDADYYNVTVGGKECPIVKFYKTPSYIQCIIPPADQRGQSQAEIQVLENNSPVPFSSGLNSNLTYSYWHSSPVYFVSPPEASEGDEVSFYGYWYGNHWDLVNEAKVNNRLLELFKPDFSTSFDSNQQNITGVLGDNTHSEAGPSISFLGGYGNGDLLWTGAMHTLSGEEYHFRTIAAVDSVSHSQSSSGGGLEVTIQGRSFPKETSKVSVEADGVECVVKSASFNEVKCVTGVSDSVSSGTVFEGNGGLVREIWYSSDAFEDLIGVVEPNRTMHLSSLRIPMNEREHMKSRIYGFFKPPRTGDYKFFITSDDSAKVFLSTDSDSSNKQTIIDFNGHTGAIDYFINSNTVSEAVQLTQDQLCYLEIWHTQNSGGSLFSMGMEIPSDGNSYKNTLPLVQKFNIEPPEVVREVQLIKIFGSSSGPTGGTIKMVYGTEVSEEINWNEAEGMWKCSDIVSSLRSTGGLRSLLCTGSWENNSTLVYNITFNYALTSERQLINVVRNGILPSGAILTSTEKTPGTVAMSGNFTLSFGGNQMQEEVSFGDYSVGTHINSQLDSLDFSLVTLRSFDDDKYQLVTMLPGNVTQGNKFQIDTVNAKGGYLEGAETEVQFVTKEETLYEPSSTQFWFVIPSDFLRTSHSSLQLKVSVDDRPVVCKGDCSFTYSSESPEITAFSESAGTVTILGTNFPQDSSLLTVTLGGVPCEVTSNSETEIQCTKPSEATAGDWKPQVHIKDLGLAKYQDSVTNTLEFVPIITSVSPAVGSTNGGTLLTITGSSFSQSKDSVSVTIGGAVCELLSVSLSELQCLTSPKSGNNELTLTINSKQATSSDFAYDASATPQITSVSPEEASTFAKTEVTIAGSGFGTDTSKVAVKLGDLICYVTSASETEVKCNLNGGNGGDYDLEVTVEGKGKVVHSSKFTLLFEISSVSPSSGSIYGSTELTIKGKGFSTKPGAMYPQIKNPTNPENNLVCQVKEVPDSETLVCVTPAITKHFSADTACELLLNGRIQAPAECKGTCEFTWSNAKSPSVTSLSPTSAQAGDQVTLSGSGFGTDSAKVQFKFGEQLASVSDCTDTSITLTLPEVSGKTPDFSLSISDRGAAKLAEGLSLTNQVKVTGVSPSQVSQGGGIVTVSGSGFEESMSFSFGSVSCELLQVSNTFAKCRTASYSSDEDPQLLSIDPDFSCSDSAVCGLSFVSAKTFTHSGVSNHLTVAGTFPSGDSASFKVYLNDLEVSADSASVSEVTCTPSVAPGTYSVKVYLEGYGFSSGPDLTFTEELQVSSVSASQSSFAGGQTVELSGTSLTSDLQVEVCGEPCKVTLASGNSLTCETPPLATAFSQSTYSILSEPKQVTDFSLIASKEGSQSNIVDGDLESFYNDGVNSEFWVGIDVGANKVLELTAFKVVGGGQKRLNYRHLKGLKVQGSNDASIWENLHTFEAVNDYWNTWDVPNNQEPDDNFPVHQYRYYRLFKDEDANQVLVNEIKVEGYLTFTETANQLTCDLTATHSSGESVTQANAVTYSETNTPVVDSISPERGTTLGGTELTLSGQGFETNAQVFIDGVECVVSTVTTTQIVCTTGQRPEYKEPSLEVLNPTKGKAATKGLTFSYSELWSELTTWGGEVPPMEGETVHIPKGQNVVLDIPTPVLNLILVEGTLTVEDKPGVTLDAHYIFVNGGKFVVGTEEKPFQNEFTLTMHGNRETPSMPTYGNKALAVRNGVLDIHGKPRDKTWTLLQATAEAGATSITLTESVDWQAGEQIVIASTSFEHTEAEVRTIESVSGTTLTLTEALKHKHYAATETYGSDQIDMRAEVGLLSRNVKIRGSEEGLDEEHGVHIMLFSPGDESVVGRVEYAEIFNAGQAFTLGRYAMHLHMVGKVSKSYIKGNSIHDTFNRACTVHGVHYLRVMHNVAYRNKGHAFFIEDGIETKNRIEKNLGISTLKSWSLLNTDQTPATFWITNPDNYFRGNHAAGSDRYGFWYDPPDHPTGPSATTDVCPKFVQIGEFSDNVAHSNQKYGLRLFHGQIPLKNPCSSVKDNSMKEWWLTNPAITGEFHRLTAWKNKRNGVISEDTGDIRFIGFKVADNKVGGIEVTYADFSEPYKTTRISDALVIGKSDNTEDNVAGAIGIITPQTDGFLVENVRFHNFDDNMWPIGDGSHSFKKPTRDYGGRLTKVKQLSFTSSHKRIHWEFPPRGMFEALDDSLTGTEGAFVGAHWTHLETPECVHQPDTYNSVVCDGTAKIRRVIFYDIEPFTPFQFINLKVVRTSGDSIPTETITEGNTTETVPKYASLPMVKPGFGKRHGKAWSIPFVTGYSYNVHWGDSPRDWESIKLELDTFESNEYVQIAMNFTDRRENFEAFRGTIPSSMNQTAEDFVDPTNLTDVGTALDPSIHTSGSFRWDNETEEVFEILISGNPANEHQFGDIRVIAHRCYGEHCEVLEEANGTLSQNLTEKRWSEPSVWPNSELPKAGDIVTVPNDWDLILDMDTPVLSYIEVQGRLTFDRNASATLNSNWVFIRGGEIVSGSPERPIPPEITHTIQLHGEYDSPSFAFDGSIEAGNKVLAIAGKLQMHGYPKKSWTSLEQDAHPGDSFIFVKAVDWKVGDEIVIAPSGFNASEHETFTITGISGNLPYYEIPPPEETNSTTNSTRRLQTVDFSSDSDWTAKQSKRNLGKNPSEDPTITHQTQPTSASSVSKVWLNKQIQFYHSGTILNFQDKLVDMRTEVGVTSRNVKIQGSDNGWACNVVVSDFLDVNTASGIPVERSGYTEISNVEINRCGQKDLQRAALRFENSNTKTSNVSNIIIKNTETWGVYIKNSANIQFTENVLYNIRWKGIVGENIKDSVFESNLVVNVFDRSLAGLNQDTPSAYFLCFKDDCTEVQIKNNAAAGYAFAGFVTGSSSCGSASSYFSNNKAHSGLHGWIISSEQKCVKGSHLTAYFNDLGVGAFSGVSDYELSSLALAENLVGIGLKSRSGNENEPYEHIITSSLIVGKTQHSYCNPSNCSIADCSSRKGFYSGVSTGGPQAASLTDKMKLPLYKQKGDANAVGNSTLNDIYFFNYRTEPECQTHNYVLKTNPKAPDYTLPTIISAVKLFNVAEDSVVYMNEPDPAWANDEDCGNWVCTGLWNAIFKDKDGSILGNEFGGDIIPNNPTIAKQSKCVFKENANGYFCPKSSQTEDEYIALIFESLDADRLDRTFSPVYVNSFGSSFKNIGGTNFNNDLNSYMDHVWDRFYTGQKRLSRFPSLVYTNVIYNITSTGTLPGKMQFRLQGNQGIDKSVILTLNYNEPKSVQITSNGKRILPIQYQVGENPVCSFSDPHGTNRWFHEDAKLQFVMRGDSELIIERI
eukprot:CAMPEP_0202427040 /NCGR_PEP_ID=MMETSP1345-20130828/1320_1 /ASSEMBLY_ACC=CAM_ASM_000843 /TAXON_ID=342563 /ORGANISM="Fabrea Fabrea salina" /LENGTH=3382 /DNA_ID=CAMNT_0049037631 /DNA_START=76 /DNA_END=10221 /DNA_ORIENTATION=+